MTVEVAVVVVADEAVKLGTGAMGGAHLWPTRQVEAHEAASLSSESTPSVDWDAPCCRSLFLSPSLCCCSVTGGRSRRQPRRGECGSARHARVPHN